MVTRAVAFRSIRPAVPQEESERNELAADLLRIGCEGLLNEPWNLRSEEMVREFFVDRTNQWEGTIRRKPTDWTPERWAETYNFPTRGAGMSNRKDVFATGKFSSTNDPKDGYLISDCKDPRERRVLMFLVPILYSEKPTRVTITLANTIFGALSEKRQVNWGIIVQQVVEKLAQVAAQGKPTTICPFLFHLYRRFECLREDEIALLEAAKVMQLHGIEPEGEETAEQEVEDAESERESLDPEEIAQLQKRSPNSRRKATYRAPEGRSPIRAPDWQSAIVSSFDFQDNPFKRIREELDQLQSQYSRLEFVTRKACELLGDCRPKHLATEIGKLQKESKGGKFEEQNRILTEQVGTLTKELAGKQEEVQTLRGEAQTRLARIEGYISHSGDIVNKAKLFDVEVRSDGRLSAPKMVAVLVDFSRKMDVTLAEMRKLFPGSSAGPSHLPDIPPESPQTRVQEVTNAVAKLVVEQEVTPVRKKVKDVEMGEPSSMASPTSGRKMVKGVPDPKMVVQEPPPRKSTEKKRRKEPTPEEESLGSEEQSTDEEELEEEGSSEEPESDGEDVEEIEPPPRRSQVNTRASGKKAARPTSQTPSKTLKAVKKEGSSAKKSKKQ